MIKLYCDCCGEKTNTLSKLKREITHHGEMEFGCNIDDLFPNRKNHISNYELCDICINTIQEEALNLLIEIKGESNE